MGGAPYASLRVPHGTPYVSGEAEAAIMILPTARQRVLARCRVARGVPLLEALKVRDVVAELGVHGQPGDGEHEEEGVGDEDDPHDVDW